ncbi:hypothetical protein [Nocardia concava]|uniref:hypothetical protein n=1 Tax=Nocardia concava TaxID=257281 RepID=UPI00031CBD66|nr:hypothetical protein [Nocardia concava]
MNLLDCQADPGPLTSDDANLAWHLHRYCDRTTCQVRERARATLRALVTHKPETEANS